ncbi:MAG TPA: hypothetical protein VHB98_05095 [Chloroflexota bacterium]|jgi:hypothetical protein|nr:hypothetical protein [Chloroflexota bacterium]
MILVLVSLVLVCSSLGAAPARATAPRTTASPPPVVALSPAPSNFRQQLQMLEQQLLAAGSSAAGQRYHLVDQVKDAQQATAVATDQQLAAVYHALSIVPNWQLLPAEVQQATLPASATAILHSYVAGVPYETGADCPAGFPGAPASIIALDGAEKAGDIALELLPDSDVYGAIVAGEGVVATLPVSVERTVVKAFTIGLEVAAFAAESTQEVHDTCVEEEHVKALDALTAQEAADAAFIEGQITALATALAADVAAIEAKLNGISGQVTQAQTTLDTKIEQRQVHLSVIAVPGAPTLLISASESGQPVPVSLVLLQVANAHGKTPFVFTNVTSVVTSSRPTIGELEVVFPDIDHSSPAYQLDGNTLYQIEVKDDGGSDVAGVTHFGTILVSQNGAQ